jgi:CubicO group peptidase (beta-lactamase class C family)
MTSARVMRKIGDERGVATPYAIEDGKATKAPHEWYVTQPSSSIAATTRDMAQLLIAHLNGGRVGERSLLSPALVREMHRQQATNHPALPGWGLAFQLDRINGVSIAEHGGDIGGFSSLFVLVPEKDAGFFIVHHGEGGNLRFDIKQALLDGLYPDPDPPKAPAPDPANAAALREYAGRYLSTLSCRTCSERGDVFEVVANPDGTLSLWGQSWLPLRRDLFIRGDGKRLLDRFRDGWVVESR